MDASQERSRVLVIKLLHLDDKEPTMKIDLLSASTVGIAGLVTAGLLALPVTATAAGDNGIAKRDEDTPELVVVNDDDDDDDTVLKKAKRVADTNTRDTRSRDRDTRTNNTRTKNTRTNSRTGANSGRDNSRAGNKKDWTNDGPGKIKRDWSVNKTNDRSRNNTSR